MWPFSSQRLPIMAVETPRKPHNYMRSFRFSSSLLLVPAIFFLVIFYLHSIPQHCDCPNTSNALAKTGNSSTAAGDSSGDDLERFIYVYDLSPHYTEDVKKLEPQWYSRQYDVDVMMTEAFMASNLIRTTDPNNASLFFIPFYSSRLVLYHHKDWENNMRSAVEQGSKVGRPCSLLSGNATQRSFCTGRRSGFAQVPCIQQLGADVSGNLILCRNLN